MHITGELWELTKYFLYSLFTGEKIDPTEWKKHTYQSKEDRENHYSELEPDQVKRKD